MVRKVTVPTNLPWNFVAKRHSKLLNHVAEQPPKEKKNVAETAKAAHSARLSYLIYFLFTGLSTSYPIPSG